MKCPKCGAPLQKIDLEEGGCVLSCAACSGAFYESSLLAVDVALSNVEETKLDCPECGGRLRTGTMYSGKLQLEQCQTCSGVWLDAGEVRKLSTLSGLDGILKPHAERAAASHPVLNKREEFHGGKELHDSATMQNPDAARAPTVAVDGVVYKHFQTSVAEVACALGEFNWKVAVGEQARARDFVAPPYLLSNEVTGKDSVWSQGRYVEASEVWKAFQLEGSPQMLSWKVAPAQPNPWQESLDSIKRAFIVSACLAAMFGMVKRIQAADKEVLRTSFAYNRSEPEKSKVSPEFVLEGPTSNVEIVTATTLSNHWAYITMALINSDTDEALDFGREVSYFSGSDSDGPWTEGSPNDRAVVPNVPPGRYYLRVEPEDGDVQDFTYNVFIKRDVPQLSPVLVAIALLELPFVFVFWRLYTFEVARWKDSDHPWVSSSDDDDD